MRVFERGVQVSSDEAKQDKISIVFGHWVFESSYTEIEAFAHYLSRRSWHSINGEEYDFTPLRGRQRRSNRWKIPFRSHRRNGEVQQGAALISGDIVIQQTGFSNFGPSRYHCSADVTINPTRALAFQDPNLSIIRAFRTGDHSQASVALPRLVATERPPFVRNERPLNSTDDNVLIDRQWLMMADTAHWPNFMRLYVYSTYAFINGLIQTSMQQCGMVGDLHHTEEHRVKEVETYWEFRSNDPMSTVRRLEPIFRNLGTSSDYREYENVLYTVGREGNVPRLSAQLLTGIKGVIYPKTTNRIRVEIRHKHPEVSNLASTYTSILDFMASLDDLSIDATQHANQLLDVVTDDLPPAQEQETAYEFVRQVIIACQDNTQARHLLSVLVHQNGYRILANDPLRSTVLRLQRAGVLRRVRPRTSSLVLTGPYRAAAHLLAQNPSSAGLEEE